MLGFFVFLFIVLFALLIIFGFGLQRVFIEKGTELITRGRLKPIFWLLMIMGVIMCFLLVTSIKVVPVGHALVVFWILPRKYSVCSEGIHLVPPIITKCALYDLRRQEYTMSGAPEEERRKDISDALWAPTKEGMQVGLDLTCWYRLQPDKVFEVHRRIGPNYEEKVVRPAIRAVVRMVVSRYEVMEVYSGKRQEIQDKINEEVKKLLEPDNFILEGIVLRNVRFTEEFAKAVEQKQIAQQEAERMDYILAKEQKEAARKAIEAEGKAKAIAIVSRELKKHPQYVNYLYVDKLSDDIRVIVSDQSTIMNFGELLKK